MSTHNIVLFAGRLLPSSETFIKAQGEGLQRFTAHYVGSRFIEGLTLPKERATVVNQGGIWGKAQEAIFKSWGIAPRVCRHIQQLNPALIHAHFGVCGALALPIARNLKLPLVVTFHGVDATMKDEYARTASLTHRVYLRRREALKRETRLFIAVSDFIKQCLVEQGFPGDRIISHPLGVDTARFQPDPSVQREPTVLFVGRLTEKKGCEYLIRSMAEVQTMLPEAKLVVIGDGELRPDLEALAANRLKGYQFLGMQPSDEVRRWMNRAQLLAVPSITAANGDSEGLPTVVVEAQAMGLPVVGSLHAGIPQAVLHQETGLLTAERDWEGMAENMLQILKEPLLWQRFSQTGQQRARTFFDLRKQTQALEDTYERIAQEQL